MHHSKCSMTIIARLNVRCNNETILNIYLQEWNQEDTKICMYFIFQWYTLLHREIKGKWLVKIPLKYKYVYAFLERPVSDHNIF